MASGDRDFPCTRASLNCQLCTRIAGAVTMLFSRPDFTVSDNSYVQLMNLHRWLALIFAVSSYGNADHIIRNINAVGGGVVDPLTLNGHNLRLFCLCYFPDSQIALQPDVLWQYDHRTVARLFLALISGRALPTSAAHGKREQLLGLAAGASGRELGYLDFLLAAVLHDVYMHCSYAVLAEKHRIKCSLSDLIRISLLAGGFDDIAVGDRRPLTTRIFRGNPKTGHAGCAGVVHQLAQRLPDPLPDASRPARAFQEGRHLKYYGTSLCVAPFYSVLFAQCFCKNADDSRITITVLFMPLFFGCFFLF